MFWNIFGSICGTIHGHGDIGGGDDGVYAGGDGGEYGLWRLSKKDEEVFCGCWNIHLFLLHRAYLQFGDFSCKNLQLFPWKHWGALLKKWQNNLLGRFTLLEYADGVAPEGTEPGALVVPGDAPGSGTEGTRLFAVTEA